MNLTFSKVNSSDDAFLKALYSTTRADEMVLAPWNETQRSAFLTMQFEAQRQHYVTKYPNGNFQIIIYNTEKVGRLYTSELDDEIRIIDISILPEYRSRGIGTRILTDILQAAAKPVTIYLESFNPSQTLFERLGFEPISDEGMYQLWQRPVNSQTNAATA